MKQLNEITFLRAADTAYAIRFLRLLTMPVEKTSAFKRGLIDKQFKKLKKPETQDERNSYTIFHRLVFNLRRIMIKAPGGRIVNYASALFLIKEKFNLSEKDLAKALDVAEDTSLVESNLFINSLGCLMEGQYTLNKEIILPVSGETLIHKGTNILVTEDTKPIGQVFNIPVFRVYHIKTKSDIYITQEDIKDA